MEDCSRLDALRSRLVALGHAEVRIIAVSKTHGPQRIRGWLDCGLRDFGENRQNEARDKFPLIDCRDLGPEQQPIFHHIGPLQSGAARQIPGLFHWVHGAASSSALFVLAQSAQHRRWSIDYLIQLDLTGEATKQGGIEESGLQSMLPFVENEFLHFRGFMVMGPSSGDPGETRQVFRRARQLRDELAPQGELSMGMSGDWELAVEEGSTMIRVGSLLFGERGQAPWKLP